MFKIVFSFATSHELKRHNAKCLTRYNNNKAKATTYETKSIPSDSILSFAPGTFLMYARSV